MIEKNFLIIDENEETLEQKVVEFVKNTFGELQLNEISIEVDSCILEEPTWTDVMYIKITFNEHRYYNKANFECVETISMMLEDNGLKPFYIDGKFVSLRVFGCTQVMPIQKTDMIYGIHKDKIYEDFIDYILTC